MEQDMTNQEKTPPLSAQEANEEAVQKKPVAFQERFPVLDENQLEEVAGAFKLPLLGCCAAPRTSSPPPQRPSNPTQSGYTNPNTLYNPNNQIRSESGHTVSLEQAIQAAERIGISRK